MRNTIGNNLTLTIFGESHGEAIGAVLDGVTPGMKVDYDFIDKQLAKRRPNGKTDTARIEKDDYKIISGVFNGYTTGSPICMIIPNVDVKSKDYEELRGIARPSHADYVANVKYDGFEDYRGGGNFSGRITASIVGLGAILLKALEEKGIKIKTHILQVGDVKDSDFKDIEKEIKIIDNKNIPVIDDIEGRIEEEILKVKSEKDSIGGIIQTAILNLPVGLGEPWFSSFEGEIARAAFAIGGIKGIEFGKGFGFASLKGSSANDEFVMKDGKVETKTNNNGGVNGGITNGMPVIFNACVKPTPSIGKVQNTVNFKTKENTTLELNGRHDPAIIRRICVVMDSLVAIVVCDMLAIKYGEKFLK